MGLVEKIEKIKKEPEHIRLRYVWFSVFISMFFIVMFWVFSLQIGNTGKNDNTGEVLDLDSLGNKIQQERESLQKINQNIKDSSDRIMLEANNNKAEVAPGEIETQKNAQESQSEASKSLSFPIR